MSRELPNRFTMYPLFVLCLVWSPEITVAQQDPSLSSLTDSGYVEVNGARLWYKIEGSGEPLLLIAGGPGVPHTYFQPFFSVLADSFRIVYFDAFGRGKSDRAASPSEYTFERDVQDIEALRGQLKLGKIRVLGHSYGGLVAQAYALQFPESVNKLILANTLYSGESWQTLTDTYNYEIANQYPQVWARIQALRAQSLRSSDIELQEAGSEIPPTLNCFFDGSNLEKMEMSFDPEVYYAITGEDGDLIVGGSIAGLDFRDQLKNLHMPTLILAGRFDRVCCPRICEQFKKYAPQAQFVMLEQSGHFPFVEEPELMFEVVRNFLTGEKDRILIDPGISERIDQFVLGFMQEHTIPGVAVAVMKGETVLKAQGYGLATVEHQVPVTPKTIFQSASLGKQFTAAAILLLSEVGTLSLLDSLLKFFPDAPDAWRGITIRHLLTHTSGIADYTDSSFHHQRDYTEEQLVQNLFELPLEFPPGSRWSYSNSGYVLLGILIHRVTGKFYGDLLREEVFTPAGMTTARVISEADIVAHRAAGYRLVNDQLKNAEWASPTYYSTADGSLYFSLRDLVAWAGAVSTGAILKPESWRLMLSPVELNSGKTYPYGFGWFIEERGGQPLLWHDGGSFGFATQLSRFVGDDLTIVVLANSEHARVEQLVDDIAATMNPNLALPELKPIEDREPEVTKRLIRLLEDTRAERLSPEQFAYMRAGTLSYKAEKYAGLLKDVDSLVHPVLVERKILGDDVVNTYELTYADRTLMVILGLAPDKRISEYIVGWK